MERIFVSYKRKNMEQVFPIVKEIESALGLKCWVDLDGIESSEQFAIKICKAINQAEVSMFPAFILGSILDKWLHWVDLHPLFLLCIYFPIAVYVAYSILLAFIQWKTDKMNR